MELLADGLLIATALTAGLYCAVLSRRLKRLTDSESGISSQILALNKALEDTRAALEETRKGVADARGGARAASETLAREVLSARQMVAELERAASAATDTMQRLRAAQRWGDDPGDNIPDWPDGVIPDPSSTEPEHAPEGADPDASLPPLGGLDPLAPSPEPAARDRGVLRVERMAL